MKLNSFKDLIVWQKAMELVKQTYILIEKLPQIERFALADQMRRSAVSIPSNIAEGYERNSTKEYINFLSIANGSKSELITQLELCVMLGYVQDVTDLLNLCDEVGKMINTLIAKLRK
jgi:four helix bundle protein